MFHFFCLKISFFGKCKIYISPSIYLNLECKFLDLGKSMENVNLQIFQPQGPTELSYRVLLLGYRFLTTATGSCLP